MPRSLRDGSDNDSWPVSATEHSASGGGRPREASCPSGVLGERSTSLPARTAASANGRHRRRQWHSRGPERGLRSGTPPSLGKVIAQTPVVGASRQLAGQASRAWLRCPSRHVEVVSEWMTRRGHEVTDWPDHRTAGTPDDRHDRPVHSMTRCRVAGPMAARPVSLCPFTIDEFRGRRDLKFR